jgi:lysophospholipase L1-like esterase
MYNAVNRPESERASVHYFDITPISRGAAGEPALIAEDGLHPSGKMYTLWAEMILPTALDILK